MPSEGYLSTHVLDNVRGLPASEVPIRLYEIGKAKGHYLLGRFTTNGDGRTDSLLIPKGELQRTTYELVFDIGAYFTRHELVDGKPFLETVPIRFQVIDENMHYHVPLLMTPFSYSTYRGS